MANDLVDLHATDPVTFPDPPRTHPRPVVRRGECARSKRVRAVRSTDRTYSLGPQILRSTPSGSALFEGADSQVVVDRQFVGDRCHILHVERGHTLDLPVDLVQLTITPLVLRGAIE